MKKYADVPKKIDQEEKVYCEKCGCEITSKNMVVGSKSGRKYVVCVKCFIND